MIQLVSVEVLVPSPARHSGLRIQCFCSCGGGHSSSSDSIPGPKLARTMEVAKKEERKKRKEGMKEGRKEEKVYQRNLDWGEK